ncbi:MAG: DivIVA domain-containing protein [Desulfurobacteriaceae bacterium]
MSADSFKGLKKRRLKPSDIRNREFSKKLFGYDPDEVDAFLAEVANSYDQLIRELEQLQRKTPEYKAQTAVEKARKEIEKLLEKKRAEKEELERQKREIEVEIEKLKLVQRKIFSKLKATIIDMTRIIEEIKPDAQGKKKEERSGAGVEGSAQKFEEQDREGGRGKAEGEGNGSP